MRWMKFTTNEGREVFLNMAHAVSIMASEVRARTVEIMCQDGSSWVLDDGARAVGSPLNVVGPEPPSPGPLSPRPLKACEGTKGHTR